MCHKSCGRDVACHKSCPTPRKYLVEACRQVPNIMACRKQCADDAACIKTCPTFSMGWLQKKLEANPGYVFKKSQKICPRLEKAQACHQLCIPGDFQCHHKCPRVWKYHSHHGKDGWHHAHKEEKAEVKPDAKECYDKGDHGVWCLKGDDWYCVKNCKDEVKKEVKPDAKGCYDKGDHGVWCPKGDVWYCVKNCKYEVKNEVKPDANGCYDKYDHSVWCPKGDDWYCVKNCTILTSLYDKLKAFVPDLSNVKTIVV